MKATYKVDGLKELDAALGQFSKSMAKALLRRVAVKALQPMAATAISLAPDDPTTNGKDLKESIKVGTKLNNRQAKINNNRDDKSFAEAFMGTGDPAGIQQELGNVNHGPQPFMRPAFEMEAPGAIKIVGEELGAEIEKTAARVAKRNAAKAARGL